MPIISPTAISPHRIGDKSWSSYCRQLILSLNPVLFIDDTTVVKGGYWVDESGNNKQVAITTDAEVNDTMTMPANDADIIAALTADNIYDIFYTDDSTPKAVRIGNITNCGSRRLFSYYHYRFFALFAEQPSDANILILHNQLHINKAWLPEVNIQAGCNYQEQANPDNPLNSEKVWSWSSIYGTEGDITYSDNILSFSQTKKTITTPIVTPSSVDTVLRFSTRSTGGTYILSFWFDTSVMGDRSLSVYCYASLAGTRNVATITAAQMYQGYTWTKTSVTGWTFNYGEVKEVIDGWARIEISLTLPSNDDINTAVFNAILWQIGLASGTAIQQDIHVTDIKVKKDSSTAITSLVAGYTKNNSNLFGKKLCVIGDSITAGGDFAKYLCYNYGLAKFVNCGVSGRRMANYDENNLYQDLPTVVAQDADIFVIFASANDGYRENGEVTGTDPEYYFGGYRQYLDYMLANLPDLANKQIVIATFPPHVGAGNTISEGKALYEAIYAERAAGLKIIGAEYGLPVCDIHGLSPMTFENSMIFLNDKTHFKLAMDLAVGDILGEFLNNLYA